MKKVVLVLIILMINLAFYCLSLLYDSPEKISGLILIMILIDISVVMWAAVKEWF